MQAPLRVLTEQTAPSASAAGHDLAFQLREQAQLICDHLADGGLNLAFLAAHAEQLCNIVTELQTAANPDDAGRLGCLTGCPMRDIGLQAGTAHPPVPPEVP